MRMLLPRLFLLPGILFPAILAGIPAGAHDWVNPDGTKVSATWIMKNPRTAHCCGPEDCEPVPGRVRYSPTGWRVEGLEGAVPMEQTHRSRDGQPWACRYIQSNKIRCLFLPKTRN